MTEPRDEDRDERTEAERAAFGKLPRAVDPPHWLEERVVGELRARGRIGKERRERRVSIIAAAVAAVVVAFAAGIATGQRLAAPVAASPRVAEAPRWMLLLYEDADYVAALPGKEGERVAEYTEWGRSLTARGRLVTAAKLADAGSLLARGPAGVGVESTIPASGAGVIAGYFVIRAANAAEAIAEAQGCPHLKYGGRISLRGIDPT